MKAKENWKSRKLTDEDIRTILQTLREGSLRQHQIAQIWQITQAYVSRLANGKASRVAVVK